MNRPLDPSDLIALGIASTSGCPLEVARAEALPLLDFLQDHGAHLAYETSTPSSAPKGDPYTTAGRIEDLKPREDAVLRALFLVGDVTSERLSELYPGLGLGVRQSGSSIRTRLPELERAGLTCKLHRRLPTRNGGTAVVWSLTERARRDLTVLGVAA